MVFLIKEINAHFQQSFYRKHVSNIYFHSPPRRENVDLYR